MTSFRLVAVVAFFLWASLVGAGEGAAKKDAAKSKPAAKSLFDGKSLGDWKPTPFGGQGDVEIKDGNLILGMGDAITGITYSKEPVRMNYEILIEAKRVSGRDFFCGLTFPVDKDPCSLIIGGWGGGLVGLSSLNGADASENDTSSWHEFKQDQWYAIRLRVVPNRIQAWIDKEKVVDVDTSDRKISIRPEVEKSRPLGIATYRTVAAIRKIEVRPVDGPSP